MILMSVFQRYFTSERHLMSVMRNADLNSDCPSWRKLFAMLFSDHISVAGHIWELWWSRRRSLSGIRSICESDWGDASKLTKAWNDALIITRGFLQWMSMSIRRNRTHWTNRTSRMRNNRRKQCGLCTIRSNINGHPLYYGGQFNVKWFQGLAWLHMQARAVHCNRTTGPPPVSSWWALEPYRVSDAAIVIACLISCTIQSRAAKLKDMVRKSRFMPDIWNIDAQFLTGRSSDFH